MDIELAQALKEMGDKRKVTETTEMIKVIANDSKVRIDRIVENYEQLEKENTELKKKCQDRCDECCEEHIKLTKAKEILREYIRINLLPPIERNFDDEVKLFEQAEQFLNSEVNK